MFTIQCGIRFSNNEVAGESAEGEHTLQILCKYNFDPVNARTEAKLELLDENRKLLSDYNQAIFDVYSVNGLHDECLMLDGEQLSERFRQAILGHQPFLSIHPFNAWHEIHLCLQRVRFCIGNMALYHPYLDNPIWHKQYSNGRPYFPSNNKSYDERYFVYCEFAYQALYNFWDRIGDRLSEIVPTNLKVKSIDFARVIDAISSNSQLNDNIHFLWICNYKNNEYKLMNEERKQLVHYESVSSQMHLLHMDSFTDRIKIEERQNWIEGRVNFFVNHFQNCVEGIRQLTMFIETK